MNNIERAMKAFKEMSDESRQEVLPILEQIAKDFPKSVALRLIIDNGRRTTFGRPYGRRHN